MEKENKTLNEEFKTYPLAKICRKLEHGRVGDISDFVFCNCNLYLGEGVHIATGVKIVGKGNVYIGNDVQIAPNVVIYTSVPNLKKKYHGRYDTRTEVLIEDVNIGNNVFIGAGAIIPMGSNIPHNEVVRALTYYKNSRRDI